MTDSQLIMKRLDKMDVNHYEAVLIAAKRARDINSRRLAQLEMMTEESDYKIDYRKVTSIALEDLVDEKISFERKVKRSE